MGNYQIIAIIKILKSLHALEEIQKLDRLYIETKETVKGFKIESGLTLNPINSEYPDRYLLLKYLSRDKYIVFDFGDIPKYNLSKCLKLFVINHDLQKIYSKIIYDFIKEVGLWVKSTGYEFIIDTHMFKSRVSKFRNTLEGTDKNNK